MGSKAAVASSLLAVALGLSACKQCDCGRSSPTSTRTRRDVLADGAQIDEGTWTVARNADGATIAFVSVIAGPPNHWDEFWLVDATVPFPLANGAEYTLIGTGPIPIPLEQLCAEKSPQLHMSLDAPKLFVHHVHQVPLTCPGVP